MQNREAATQFGLRLQLTTALTFQCTFHTKKKPPLSQTPILAKAIAGDCVCQQSCTDYTRVVADSTADISPCFNCVQKHLVSQISLFPYARFPKTSKLITTTAKPESQELYSENNEKPLIPKFVGFCYMQSLLA